MGQSINLGRVSIVPQGEWVSGVPYTALDLVSYLGSSYVSKKDNNTSSLTNLADWLPIAKKGEQGEPGEKGDDGVGEKGDDGLYNTTINNPPSSGFHTLQTAISTIPVLKRKVGMLITFEPSANKYEVWLFNNTTLTGFETISSWSMLVTKAYVDTVIGDINTILESI